MQREQRLAAREVRTPLEHFLDVEEHLAGRGEHLSVRRAGRMRRRGNRARGRRRPFGRLVRAFSPRLLRDERVQKLHQLAFLEFDVRSHVVFETRGDDILERGVGERGGGGVHGEHRGRSSLLGHLRLLGLCRRTWRALARR